MPTKITKFRIDKTKLPDFAKLTEEQVKWNEQCYGMSLPEMVDYLDSNLRMTFQRTLEETRSWLVMCMLSDVQELIERDRKNEARQLVNRVKYLLNVKMESYVKELPDDE
jgi:hypothetical protein